MIDSENFRTVAKMLRFPFGVEKLTSEQIENIRKLKDVRIRDTETWKKIYKKYPNIPNYTSFENIAARLTGLVALADVFGIQKMVDDPTLVNMIISAKLTELDPTPVYWLDVDLLQAFLNTDLPSDLTFIKKVLPRFILMIPKVLMSDDNDFLDFVIIEQWDNEPEYIRTVDFKSDGVNLVIESGCKKISYRTVMSNEVIYVSTIEIISDDNNSIRHGDFYRGGRFAYSSTQWGKDVKFSEIIERIVLLTLIYLQTEGTQTSLIAATDENEIEKLITKGAGFGKNAKKPVEVHRPIWIGRGYKTEVRKIINDEEEKESRKYDVHTHDFMRRGHLRRVVVGKREDNLREWRWIPPVRIIR